MPGANLDGMDLPESKKKYISEKVNPLLEELVRSVLTKMPDEPLAFMIKTLKEKTGKANVDIDAINKENALLAKKFHVLYYLCEQQLSKQAHYDFGLRNILAVLRTAGASRREALDAPEPMLIMRTLRDMNLSKYVAEDVPLFLSLISDLFPGIAAEKSKHAVVERALSEIGRASCRERV